MVANCRHYIWLYLHLAHIGQLVGPPPKTCTQRKVVIQGDSRNNARPRPNFLSDHKIALSSNEASDTPQLVKISKNIFISNVHILFQIMLGMLSLKFAIVNQGVPYNLMCLLHKPLESITNQIRYIRTKYYMFKVETHGPRICSTHVKSSSNQGPSRVLG